MKRSINESAVQKIAIVLMTLVSLLCILPILNVFATSFSGSTAVDSGRVGIWPVDFTVHSFELLIKGTMVVKAFKNGVIITVVGVLINMAFTICAAYPLSKKYFLGNSLVTKLIIFTMLFGGGMIPTYIVVQRLGLVNSFWALWLPGAISTYNMIVMRTFFNNIPISLEEAAIVDGCSEWKLLFRIFLPLSKPVLATMVLFYGVGHWNAFQSVVLYINDPAKQNLAVLVYNMINSMTVLNSDFTNMNPQDAIAVTAAGVRAAGVVVMIVPMMCVYPFIQKYFVHGIMLGAVKG